MVIKDLKSTKKRKLLGTVVICVALIVGITMLWQMGQVAEAAILDPHPGLVGWWHFDQGDEVVAEDSSGFGNDGAVYGAINMEGKVDEALSFDGVDDYVQVADSSELRPTTFTYGLWFYRRSHDANYEGIIVKWTQAYQGVLIESRATGNLRILMGKGGSGSDYITIVEKSINNYQWYHLALTYDGADAILYLNGTAETPVPTAFEASSSSLLIGKRDDVVQGCFDGTIDEVRIYNRALSANEIETLFRRGPDFSSKLVAKVPKGTTQFLATLSWQGVGSIDITVESPSETYTEDMMPVYQKTVYSSGNGGMLNIKRLVISVTPMLSDEDWYVVLEFDNIEDYMMTVEVQT